MFEKLKRQTWTEEAMRKTIEAVVKKEMAIV